MNNFAEARNCRSIDISAIPYVDQDTFFSTLHDLLRTGYRLCSLFAFRKDDGNPAVCGVCADDRNGALLVALGTLDRASFDSLTPEFTQAHLFEREIYEQTGVVPRGHPWLRPVRFPHRAAAPARIGDCEYFSVEGQDIHEVAVGPVHAGIIEPGHFRFQCHGETVHHLQISLGYQHRGIERALLGGPHPSTPFQIEAAAGDTSIAHGIAYCQAIETLTGCRPTLRAHAIRALALELERCANHTGDLGALAGDVGFLPTQAFCGRIRGDFLNMTALLCGNRFGRGLVVPGGVSFDLEPKRIEELLARLTRIRKHFLNATDLIWKTPSVLARFEGTGVVGEESSTQLGLVGPAARASGCNRDVRQDHAFGYYRAAHIPVVTSDTGDVYARAYLRWREAQESMDFLIEHLASMPEGTILTHPGKHPPPGTLAVSMTEGWRGEVCHTALTDNQGRFLAYKLVDPSFHNWTGLALALRGQQISDFPLCNKSFNLSYCGFDL